MELIERWGVGFEWGRGAGPEGHPGETERVCRTKQQSGGRTTCLTRRSEGSRGRSQTGSMLAESMM